jgi:hypothetical protein
VVDLLYPREEKWVGEVMTALVTRYPHMPEAEIRRLVEAAQKRFGAARIRTYVPVLVEREVRERLRQLHQRVCASRGRLVPAARTPALDGSAEITRPVPAAQGHQS